jgi:hypothetical protein
MRSRLSTAAVLAALVLLTAQCGDDESTTVDDRAQETATSVAGQAEAATRLTATLTGAAETPNAGDPDGTGTATVNLDVTKGEICYEISSQRIDRPTGMHIHEGAAGNSGGIVVPLTTPTASDTVTRGCANADRTLMGRIVAKPGDFYVNVHSTTYPQGAVRGQLSQ